MNLAQLSSEAALLIDVVALTVVGVLLGMRSPRLSDQRLLAPRRWKAIGGWENGGNWYRRWLKVHKWKRFLPQAGDAFAGGRSLDRLGGRNSDALSRFRIETIRAELVHRKMLGFTLLFPLWNPPLLSAVMVSYGLVANAPFIAVQRYNRARVERLLRRKSTVRVS